MPAVFISHSNVDRAAAFELRDRLETKGYQTFLDFESIAGGAEWERQIYEAVRKSVVVLLFATPEACQSRWVFAEVSIARFHGLPVIPLLMRECEVWDHLGAVQHIDFRTDPRAAYEKLWEALAPLRLERPAAVYRADRPPYPGLAALQYEDAAVFFGRERELDAAVEALRPGGRQRRFLAVVGPSGSGKSSFVRAGVIPALTRGVIPDSNRWLYVPPFMPGETPFRNLAEALCAADKHVPSVMELEQRLRQRGGLLDAVLTARAHSGVLDAQVVVVLDQLEEIERRTPKYEAEAFLEALAGALGDASTPLMVMATLRSDFLSQCLQFPALAPFLASDSLLLGAMHRAALGEAVRGPARIGGVAFEDGLVETILDETEGGDALPLMADALRQLWATASARSPRRITREDYRALGGVQGGLAGRAQELYDNLDQDARFALRSVLIQLADVNEKGDFTRRRLPADLIPRDAKPAVDHFVAARLLIRDTDGIAVSHEALLRNWPLLRQWLEEESDKLRLRRQIELDAREWEARGRAEEYLWRAKRLEAARELMKQERWPQSDVRRLFLDAGRAHERSGRERESEQLANRIFSEYEKDPERGILLAVAAVETYGWTPRAELALNTTIDRLALRAILKHDGSVWDAAFSPDGTRVVTVSYDKTANVWDAATGEALHMLRGHEKSVNRAAFSPDGTLLVTASDDNTARLWDMATGEALHVLRGHDADVRSAAFSPDGTRIVTASGDETARLWDAVTGGILHTLRGHEFFVDSAVFSPDGTRIVTASDDKTARIWDAATGGILHTLRGHDGDLRSAGFSPDGARVVTTSADNTARLWDAATGEALLTLRGHEAGLMSAIFNVDGTRLVTASHDYTARVWDAATGEALLTLRGHENLVLNAAFSSDGTRIVTASADNTARLWHAATGETLQTLRGHAEHVRRAVFSPNGTSIVTASYDDTARLWDSASGDAIQILRGHDGSIWSAAFSPDGARIVTRSSDRSVRLWDATTGEALHTFRVDEKHVAIAAFSTDGTRLVTASNDNTAGLWDATTGEVLHVLRGHEASVLSVAFSADGTRVVTASEDNTARLWDATSGRVLHILSGHEARVLSAAFSLDGALMVTASADNTARVWHAMTGEVLHTLHHREWVRSAAFSPDGTRIVTASDDKTARLWHVATGEALHTFGGHRSWIHSTVFSPDGARILTASGDKTARIWDVVTGGILHTLWGHEQSVESAVFSPDGTRIVTSSYDRTAALWDAATGEALREFRGHEGGVLSAAFSPDGARIVTSSEDKTARVWVLRSRESLLALAKERVFRQLTPEERRYYGLPQGGED